MIDELLMRLCSTFSGAGSEKKIAELIKLEMKNYTNQVILDKNYNVVCNFGKSNSKNNILIEAHIDQISMVVTSIDDSGFVSIAPCGGIDCRVLPGATMSIYGKKIITGIVCTTPPHLKNKEVKSGFEKTENLLIDTGVTKGKLKELVSAGDYVSFNTKPKKLLNNKITAPALDNRAGVAVLIRCAQILSEKKSDYNVTFLFSSQEEINALGARTASFSIEYNEAICVDVSFAKQPNIPDEKCGILSNGPMIGVAPVLSKDISSKFVKLAKENNIPYQLEIMNSVTGTTADVITVSKKGARGGLLSVPLRYMHTPVEVVDVNDIENTAKLLALYILTGGNNNE